MAGPQYPCEECGSTDFYEDNGRWWCHNGHVQEGGQQITQEEGTEHGPGSRLNRRRLNAEKQKISKVYRGSKGFELFLKAWQYILWKQSHTLIHQYGLPSNLWTLVRELWTLRLSKLTTRFVSTHGSELTTDTDAISTSESDIDVDKVAQNVKHSTTSKKLTDNPGLSDTISLNFIGILLLRHPMRLSSIYECIRQEDICYIRAIRHVPPEMRERLAPEYHLSLDTTTIPTKEDLQLAVYRTARMYVDGYGMEMPPLNWTLMLVDDIRTLALPPEVFVVVKYLAQVVEYDFTYPIQQYKRQNATTYPEAQHMALVVVATKLLYPFDSNVVQRHPRSAHEAAAIRLDWEKWLDTRNKTDAEESNDKLTPQEAIEVTDTKVLQMTNDHLDQYMDWFQQTYAKDVDASQVYKQVLDMFPTNTLHDRKENANEKGVPQMRTLTRLRATQANLTTQYPVTDDDDEAGIRPGQRYPRYESLDEMSEAAKVFHEQAAKLACLDISSLLRACTRTESLLLRYQHEQRRANYFDDQEEANTH